MQIVSLFMKPVPHQGVKPCDRLTLRQHTGIVGDAGAIVGSPRQVLLVGTDSLDRYQLEPGQLQENVLVQGNIEQFSSGQVWQLGDWAQVRLTFLCEPCATLEKLQPGLMKRIQGKRGFLGMVVQDGDIRLGDPVLLTQTHFPAMPEPTGERFQWFIAQIPPGKVVTIPDVLLALGLTPSYARAIPAMIRKASVHQPVHRIVTTNGSLLTKYMPHQQQALHDEGVKVMGDRVLNDYRWEAIYYHS